MAKTYGDEYNFGFMDYKTSEFVMMNYDLPTESYGEQTPVMAIFKDRKVYPLLVDATNAIKFNEHLTDPVGSCKRNCGQTIQPLLSEASIYIQYAKRDIG